MRFTMSVDMDNAAFGDNPNELTNVLNRIAADCFDDGAPELGIERTILDTNGNRVGSWKIAEED